MRISTILYSNKCIDDSHRFAATTLESTLFVNDGTGHYEPRPLPRIAQIAPGFGVQFTEVNGDANPDVYLVHNFYWPQPETGQMDGGLSQLLAGQGDGSFVPIEPRESGLVFPGDATSLTIADVNLDSRLDFVIGSNEGAKAEGGGMRTFAAGNQFEKNLRMVTLNGLPGNPTAIGSRVAVKLDDETTQTDEVRAGSGYLSQSMPTLVFGCPDGQRVAKIEIRWPDGVTSEHSGVSGQLHYKIRYPESAK